jgi:glutaredoxin-like protein NrdH
MRICPDGVAAFQAICAQSSEEEMNVTVYSKPACVQCTATTRALDRQGIDYQVIDISADMAAYDLVTGLGYRQVPVVVAGETHWAGFRPDMINGLS